MFIYQNTIDYTVYTDNEVVFTPNCVNIEWKHKNDQQEEKKKISLNSHRSHTASLWKTTQIL